MLNKIPKIAHFYWDGSRMAYLQYLTVVSFHKWNPDWEIMIYTPKIKYSGDVTWKTHEQRGAYSGINYYPMFKRLPYITQVIVDFNEYEDIPNDIPETYKSDLLRWHLLATTGGLWSDMDVLYIKPVKEINIPRDTEFTICKLAATDKKEFHIIGFYLSSSNNPFFHHIVKYAPHYLSLDNYQSVGSTLLNQLYPNDNEIRQITKQKLYTKIGMDVLYAYPPFDENNSNQLPALFAKKDLSRITRNTLGIHWYNGHGMAKSFNNEFNHLTMSQFDNTITHYIKLLNKDAEIIY
jgi:hypothetical protein